MRFNKSLKQNNKKKGKQGCMRSDQVANRRKKAPQEKKKRSGNGLWMYKKRMCERVSSKSQKHTHTQPKSLEAKALGMFKAQKIYKVGSKIQKKKSLL